MCTQVWHYKYNRSKLNQKVVLQDLMIVYSLSNNLKIHPNFQISVLWSKVGICLKAICMITRVVAPMHSVVKQCLSDVSLEVGE